MGRSISRTAGQDNGKLLEQFSKVEERAGVTFQRERRIVRGEMAIARWSEWD